MRDGLPRPLGKNPGIYRSRPFVMASISFAVVCKETITQFIAIIKSEIVHVGVVSD